MLNNNEAQFCIDITSYEKSYGLPLRTGVPVRAIFLRRRFTDLEHESHLGIVQTKQRVRQRIWWPKIDVQVDHDLEDCNICQTNEKTSVTAATTLHSLPYPSGSWKELEVGNAGPCHSYPHSFSLQPLWSITSAGGASFRVVVK